MGVTKEMFVLYIKYTLFAINVNMEGVHQKEEKIEILLTYLQNKKSVVPASVRVVSRSK